MMATDDTDWDQGEGLLPSAAGASTGKAGRGSPTPPQSMSMCGLLSIKFYQPYFDVDTSDVKTRLFRAAWPIRKPTSPFLGEGESSQVDLYGPVWISATLIFLISVAANARRAMMDAQTAGEFDEVSTSAYSVLAYLLIGSTGLWMFFRAHSVPLSYPEALSVYGYSLTPFLGAAPVCLFSWPLRSAGLATASLVAAIFVLRSAWPRLQEHMPEKSMVLLLAAVATYHVLWFLLLTAV